MKPLLHHWLRSVRSFFCLLSLTALAATARADDGPYALSFDGVDDHAAVPHSTLFNNSQLSATAWIKTSQATGEPGLINKYVAGSLNGWQVFLFNGEVRTWFFRDNANFIWDGGRGLNGGFVANGQWHHVAFTVDLSGGRLYVDGVLRDSRSWTGTPGNATTTQELRLGSYPSSGFYNGLIDEVTVWSKGLTLPEILAGRSNSLTGYERELRGYFRLTEGSGTSVRNSAFGGPFVPGALVNGPAWVPGVVLKPGVMTLPQSAVTSGSAWLNGLASAGGTNANVRFDWGTTTNYGNSTPSVPIGGGGNETNFNQLLASLPSDIAVQFRAVASNAMGLAFGSNFTFIPLHTSLNQEREGHTATLLPNGKVLVTGGYGASVGGIGFPTNSAEIFDPTTGTWTPTSPMSVGRGFHTATLLLNGKVLVADGQGAELFNPVTGTWSSAGTPQRFHNVHTATLLQNGKVLLAGGVVNQPEIYDPVAGTWTPTGSLITSRYHHTATVLHDGKVLVAGGQDVGTAAALVSAELYDPISGTWTNTGSMNDARVVHTATLEINGKVLVVGGSTQTNYLNSSERYNPLTGTWQRLGEPLVQARGYHTATLLPRGAVLVVGGYPYPSPVAEVLEMNSDVWQTAEVQPALSRWDHTATLLPGAQVLIVGGNSDSSAPLADVELLDPHEGTWTSNAPMANLRYGHTSTLLPNGRVLVSSFGSTEIYNPTNGAWSNAPALNNPRYSHTATLLANGKVLVTGGIDGSFNGTASTEVFDPALGTWANAGAMSTNRYSHTATLLPNGKVLIAGGSPAVFGGLPVSSADLYDPVTGLWTNTGPMTERRTSHTATLLPNGQVLVAGGSPDNFGVTGSAELYDLATGVWTLISPMTTNRSGHKAVLLPNGTVLVAGGVPGAFSLAIASAEIYDPANGTWKATASMNAERQSPSATLLPNGRVLVAGGYGQGYLSSADLYDRVTRTWTATAAKGSATYQHAATLLPNGKVLVTGGWNGNTGTNRAELFEMDLGFTAVWQSHITNRTSPLVPGGNLILGGIRFRGVSGASYGRDKDSPSDVPVVQVRSLDNERTTILSSTNWSTNSFTSLPVIGLLPGWVMATVFVNGIPSTASILEISAPVATSPILTDFKKLPNETFQFRFTNAVGALFGVLASTNVALPSSNWTVLGGVPEIAPGRFQFTEPVLKSRPQRFYRVRSL